MMLIFKNAKVYEDGKMITRNVSFDGVALSSIEGDVSCFDENSIVIDNICVYIPLRRGVCSYLYVIT